MLTRAQSHCLEQIYLLSQKDGVARARDIAQNLDVGPSTITKTLQKLDQMDLIVYNKYEYIVLTPKGELVGEKIALKHEILQQFMLLLEIDPENAHTEVERIEHYVSDSTVERIKELVQFFNSNPSIAETFARVHMDAYKVKNGKVEDP
ncbi:metal-dependent transcriptional regulator [Paenibacillus azoreducens]|uniref:metal-dependent transcriptional regulator n=1 Tax=Paenibacillus azoreducens TaxID=116718 RepID=UPI0039F4B053